MTDVVVGCEERKLLLLSSGRICDESRSAQDLEGELVNFEPTVLKGGSLRYEAGSGCHNGSIMALCLAHAEASHAPQEPMIEFIEFDSVTGAATDAKAEFVGKAYCLDLSTACNDVSRNIKREVRHA